MTVLLRKKQIIIMILLALILLACLASPVEAAMEGPYGMLINKEHRLPEDYVPAELVRLSDYMKSASGVRMEPLAAEALGRMAEAMAAAGINDVYGQSGYRSFDLQSSLHQNKIAALLSANGYDRAAAEAQASTVVSPPGASEHQSGLAIDLATGENGGQLTEDFAATQAGQWLAANCWRYGFILRYPQGKEQLTGYVFEPWHFRYVGAPHAEYMTQFSLCMEEYFALLAKKEVLTFDAIDGLSYAVYYTAGSYKLGDSVLTVSPAYYGGAERLITLQPQKDDLADLTSFWGLDYIEQALLYSVLNGQAVYNFIFDRPLLRQLSRSDLAGLVESYQQHELSPLPMSGLAVAALSRHPYQYKEV